MREKKRNKKVIGIEVGQFGLVDNVFMKFKQL